MIIVNLCWESAICSLVYTCAVSYEPLVSQGLALSIGLVEVNACNMYKNFDGQIYEEGVNGHDVNNQGINNGLTRNNGGMNREGSEHIISNTYEEKY
jgi:hypothetical protein